MTYMGVKEGRLGLSEVEKLASVVRPVMAGPDSKAREPGEYFVPVEPNAFGIPAVHTCPGSTVACEKKCYAIKSEGRDKTSKKMRRNLEILLRAETVEGMAEKLREAVGDYVARADRLGIPPEERRFRVHWDGDFYDVEYAEAWKIVMEENPDIKFYVYTRSFHEDVNVLPVLTGIDNLDLFMSVDRNNVLRAAEAIKDAPDARVAYFVEYQDEAEQLIEIMGRQKEAGFHIVACPENMYKKDSVKRRLPVISERGGACSVCQYCIDSPKTWDVIFVTEHVDTNPHVVIPVAVPVTLSLGRREKIPLVAENFENVAQPVGELALLSASQSSLF